MMKSPGVNITVNTSKNCSYSPGKRSHPNIAVNTVVNC